jgi:ComF family protein
MGALDTLLHLLFPPRCLACARLEVGLSTFCETCATTLEPLPRPHCDRCSEPGQFVQNLCPRCAQRPPPFTRAHAPFIHGGALARAIHAFKYEDHPELAGGLAGLWTRHVGDFFRDPPDRLVALPLHRSRFRRRKYDQAQLLAAALAGELQRPLLERGLARTRNTLRQVGLSHEEREANVDSAFLASNSVQGQRILLVDDVLTTGASARSASHALLKAGAREVQVLTLARAYSSQSG